MNTPNQNTPGQNLALIAELYALLCDVITVYFEPPRIPEADRLQGIYSGLYAAIGALLSKRGMEHLQRACALPYPSLYGLGDDAEAEWKEIQRRRVIETLASIEQQYYAAGSPALPDDNKTANLIDKAKKILKKYKKAQKKVIKKSGSIMPEPSVAVQNPSPESSAIPTAAKTEALYILEKGSAKKKSIWKTIIIGIIIGIITGTVARLIVYFITRYLE